MFQVVGGEWPNREDGQVLAEHTEKSTLLTERREEGFVLTFSGSLQHAVDHVCPAPVSSVLTFPNTYKSNRRDWVIALTCMIDKYVRPSLRMLSLSMILLNLQSEFNEQVTTI